MATAPILDAKTTAARVLVERFVRAHGGNIAAVYREGQSYRWRMPDGRIVALGWK